jgi:P-type Cu2+ transporter
MEHDGHGFCCFGCKEVYRTFGPGVLNKAPSEAQARGDTSAPKGSEAFLRIDGMHCASCEILIERMAERIDGVLAVKSSYATSTAMITYDPDVIDEAELPSALKVTGYRARLSSDEAPDYDDRLDLLRVLTGAALTGLVMMLYIAFFYPANLGLIDPADLEPVRWLAYGLAPKAMLVAATIVVAYVGAPIFWGAWIGLRAKVLNMDNLLAIAILAAYGYSVGQLIAGGQDLYFDVAVMITTVVTVGRYFERGAKARVTAELVKLLKAWTPKVRTRWGSDYRIQEIDDLVPGAHIFVWQGEPVPVNGRVVSGAGAVDQSLMTGEPFPTSYGPGDEIVGGATLVEGELEIEVGKPIESRMDDLARVLWNVQSGNAGVQGIADMVARVFVPTVLVLAVLVFEFTHLLGASWGAAVLAGLATLIVSCPCTFGLAIPLTTAAGVSAALRRGIVIASADTFDKAPRVDIVAIDKTGTLSSGDMSVADVCGPPETIEYAAAVERQSVHPIAKAIAKLDKTRSADDLSTHPGRGAVAMIDGQRAAVGAKSMFATLGWDVPEPLSTWAAAHNTTQGAVSFVGWGEQVRGAILTHDESRPEWAAVVDRLRAHCRVVLLTGAEHSRGFEDRVDDVFTGVPPEGKAAVIRQLRKEGTVVMVGDGSNDAPALAAADLGIAFGASTALAAEAADVVIMGGRLERIFDALDLIAVTRRRVRQNLGWALLYNAVAIPLAVTGLLNPFFAAVAMSTSSLLVVWNSSRPLQDNAAVRVGR